jgi:hypothetical protein
MNCLNRLTRVFSYVVSRRGMVGATGLATLALPVLTEAKKMHRHKKKSVKRNEFGCVNVGSHCKSSDQCCSGICQGKQGKKTCQAHHTGGCSGELHACAGDLVPCVTATDENGVCARTTGNAGYCLVLASNFCAACTRDSDCQARCGPQAACIVCESECEPNGTGCVGPSGVSC